MRLEHGIEHLGLRVPKLGESTVHSSKRHYLTVSYCCFCCVFVFPLLFLLFMASMTCDIAGSCRAMGSCTWMELSSPIPATITCWRCLLLFLAFSPLRIVFQIFRDLAFNNISVLYTDTFQNLTYLQTLFVPGDGARDVFPHGPRIGIWRGIRLNSLKRAHLSDCPRSNSCLTHSYAVVICWRAESLPPTSLIIHNLCSSIVVAMLSVGALILCSASE